MNAESKMISILCPTRGRPENVKRLVESIISTAHSPELCEILFYVDNDDYTFPPEIEKLKPVKVYRGPGMWISNLHNFLYIKSRGEILFSAGDDMIFRTIGWDSIVREKFEEIPDKIGLIFGDDLGTHSGVIATHGFFHRRWVESLGTWVQPGRGSLWDLWSTETALKLKRLFFVRSLIIEHKHYRQSSFGAQFDTTYQRIRTSNSSFRPEISYRKLRRERRIDRLILGSVMTNPPPLELNYWLSEKTVNALKSRLNTEKQMYIRTLGNLDLVLLLFKVMINQLTFWNRQK
jgi:hypothetical protein